MKSLIPPRRSRPGLASTAVTRPFEHFFTPEPRGAPVRLETQPVQDFEYAAPFSIGEAIALLQQGGPDARVLAGGTDLIVQAREGRRTVRLMVDIKKIPEMNEIRFDGDTGLTIGAAAPCYRVCANPDVRRYYPALVDGAGIIGGVQIQGRASIGGNLCNSSPAGDSLPALLALDARCTIEGPEGRKTVPAKQFCTAPGRNLLGQGELLISIQLPKAPGISGSRYLRFIPRNEMDIAVAGAAVFLAFDGEVVTAARIALGAVAPTPLLVTEAADALVGAELSDHTIGLAARACREAARPITDMRGSIEQRKHLAEALTRRAIEGAAHRAGRQIAVGPS